MNKPQNTEWLRDMRIGIDIDGVLTNIEEYQLKHGKVFFRKKYRKEVVAPDAFDISHQE